MLLLLLLLLANSLTITWGQLVMLAWQTWQARRKYKERSNHLNSTQKQDISNKMKPTCSLFSLKRHLTSCTWFSLSCRINVINDQLLQHSILTTILERSFQTSLSWCSSGNNNSIKTWTVLTFILFPSQDKNCFFFFFLFFSLNRSCKEEKFFSTWHK